MQFIHFSQKVFIPKQTNNIKTDIRRAKCAGIEWKMWTKKTSFEYISKNANFLCLYVSVFNIILAMDSFVCGAKKNPNDDSLHKDNFKLINLLKLPSLWYFVIWFPKNASFRFDRFFSFLCGFAYRKKISAKLN